MTPTVRTRTARTLGLLALIALPFLVASPALAQSGVRNTLDAVGTPAYGTSNPDALPQTFGRIVQGALGLLGMILVVLCLYAGFMWMTAGGNEEKVTTAKTTLRNAVIGLILILLSYSITAFVIEAITSRNAQVQGQAAGSAAHDAGCSVPGSQGCAN